MPGSINIPPIPAATLLLEKDCAERLPRQETLALISTLNLQKYDSALSRPFVFPQFGSICISNDKEGNLNLYCCSFGGA